MKGLQQTSLSHLFHSASAILLAAGLPLSAIADSLSIKKVAEYRNADKVQKVLREECRIDTRLPEIIQDEVEKISVFSQVSLTDDPLTAPHEFALVASIITLEASADAGWSSGTKFLKVKAIVSEGKMSVNSFAPRGRVAATMSSRTPRNIVATAG